MHTGSCLCEAIKYSVDDELKACVNCYCQYCRKAHGSEFVTVAFAPASKLTILEGKESIAEYPIPKLSSFRCFCSKCGTRLYNIAPAVGMLSLVTATLSNPAAVKPLANINTESRLPNTVLNPGLPAYRSSPSGAELQELLRE